MSSSKHIVLFEIFLFFLICWGAHAWFTWGLDSLGFLPNTLLRLSFAAIAFFYASKQGIRMKFTPRVTLGIICYIIAVNIPFISIGEFIAQLILFYPILVLLCDEEYSERHLRFISIALSIILIPGFCLFAFRLAGDIPFIGYPVQYGDSNVNQSYVFLNYGFMLVRVWEADDIRFGSVFLEPGYLGTLLSFLLYANNFQLKKWYNVVLLVGLVLSFSLAGYITTVLGYFFYCIANNKSIRQITLFALLIIAVFSIAPSYKQGNNMVNELIVQRLQYDEEKGISGNDRLNDASNAVFESALKNGDIIWGNRKADISGAGYKKFLVVKGLISALFFILFYYCVGKNSNTKYGLFFFLLILITSLQAAYPESYAWLISYIIGINCQSRNENSIYNEYV